MSDMHRDPETIFTRFDNAFPGQIYISHVQLNSSTATVAVTVGRFSNEEVTDIGPLAVSSPPKGDP